MAERSLRDPEFTIDAEATTADAIVVGFSEFGLAGLTAVDYLTEQRELVETGHLSTTSMPSITPFADGTPRHHTRIYGGEDDLTFLVGELLVPPDAAPTLADELLSWADENDVEEITILSGVPVAHGPDEHRPFYVATPDYREARLTDVDLDPMGSGYMEGLSAELMGRGLDSDLRVGLLTTPAHAQAPDADAALRLLDALTRVYDVDVDTGPLEAFAERVRSHYEDLAERLAEREEPGAEDRMYM